MRMKRGKNLNKVLLGLFSWAILGWSLGTIEGRAASGPDFSQPDSQTIYIAELVRSAKDPKGDRRHTITFDVPPVVENGAMVPVSLRLDHPMEAGHYIQSLVLFDEASLIKLKSIARLSPENGRAFLSTSIRLARSTKLKAVAECNLHGRWLGISPEIRVGESGCGAAISRPTPNFSGNILRVKFSGRGQKGKPLQISLTIKHPMESGMTLDKEGKATRSFPAFFMKDLQVFYGGKLVSKFELGPGLSNNPVLEFMLQAGKDGSLKLKAINTDGQSFEDSVSFKSRSGNFF